MKIAYLIGEDLETHPGLKDKILGQAGFWSSWGHEVHLVEYRNRQSSRIGDENRPRQIPTVERQERTRIGKLLSLGKRYRYVEKILPDIKPDLTYCRYMFPFPGLAHSLKAANRLVVEINSNDRSELFLRHVTSGIYNLLFRGRLLNRADGFVFVTHELVSDPAFNFPNTPRTVIGNGIDLGQTPFLEPPRNARPQLCFIGSPSQAWQGFDKLAPLARLLPHCDIHVIGPSRDACLTLWGEAPKNLQVHGYLDAAAMTEMMPMFDIGISTLALHRKQMGEACPLKIRQYLAYGMPAITAYRDPDVPDTAPFVLKLPNTEDNVATSAVEIRRFVDFAFGNEDLRRQARAHAEQRLDHALKETQRLQFFEQLVGHA